jgi:hypothetical protein
VKCEFCKMPLAFFPRHTVDRCRDHAAKNLDTALVALRAIRNVEMSATPPHTVDAGVRLVAADALTTIEGQTP